MSDVFHKNYNPNLSEEQKNLIVEIKNKAEELYALLEKADPVKAQFTPNLRAHRVNMAMNRLEECVMWVVKGITTKD